MKRNFILWLPFIQIKCLLTAETSTRVTCVQVTAVFSSLSSLYFFVFFIFIISSFPVRTCWVFFLNVPLQFQIADRFISAVKAPSYRLGITSFKSIFNQFFMNRLLQNISWLGLSLRVE